MKTALDTSPTNKRSEYLATNSPEVDFALVLARVIDSVKQNPSELRQAIYELARIKLHRADQTSRTSTVERVADPASLDLDVIWDEEWQKNLLETAIERVEAISSKQDELQALQSLDHLIENLNISEPASSNAPAGPALLIDHSPPNQGGTPGVDAWPRQLAFLQPKNLPFLLWQLKRLSSFRWRGGTGPTLRIFMVLAVAVTLYATLNRFGFFGRPDIVTSSVPPVEVVQPVERTAVDTAAEEDRARGFPLPSVYGIYAVSDGKLFELEALPGRVPDQRIFMSAIISKPSKTVIEDGRIFFVAFRRDLATSAPDRIAVRYRVQPEE